MARQETWRERYSLMCFAKSRPRGIKVIEIMNKEVDLGLRENLGQFILLVIVNARRRCLIVTGKHYHFDFITGEALDRFFCRVFDRVRDAKQANNFFVGRDKHDSLPIESQIFGSCLDIL